MHVMSKVNSVMLLPLNYNYLTLMSEIDCIYDEWIEINLLVEPSNWLSWCWVYAMNGARERLHW